MAAILDYFDTINIDVAKRKYYNVNKVNSVLDDLKRLATDLVEENERLKAELEVRVDQEKSAAVSLEEIQTVYRETLGKAHERADVLVTEAEESRQEAGQRAEYAAKQMEACVRSLRAREEQNIEFLETKLRQFMDILEGTAKPAWAPEDGEPRENEEHCDGMEFPTQGEKGSVELREIEKRISQLAKEIKEMESEEA